MKRKHIPKDGKGLSMLSRMSPPNCSKCGRLFEFGDDFWITTGSHGHVVNRYCEDCKKGMEH